MGGGQRFTVAILALACFAFRADAQERPHGEQTHAFRFALKANGLKSLNTFDELTSAPANKLLVLTGRFDPLDQHLRDDGLRDFLAAGGAVLIASDHPTPPELSRQVSIRITGERVRGDLMDCYRGQFVDCPLLHEASLGPVRIRHSIFQNLPNNPRIATNRPSLIQWDRSITILIATILTPGRGFNISRLREFPGQSAVAAIRHFANDGRLLVLADHSIFSNDMMIQSDNDNFLFALGAIRWLADDGKRTEVLFIENGEIQSDLDASVQLPPLPPMLPLDALIPLANKLMAGLQQENAMNRMIAQAVPRREMLRGVAVFITLALLAWGVYRFLNARQRGEPRPAKTNQPAANTALSELRPQAVLAAGQFGEAARELAHQTFADLGVPVAPGTQPPEVAVRGGWLTGWRWSRRVADLWTLAADGGRVSAKRLQRVLAELHALRDAVRTGVVQLHPAR